MGFPSIARFSVHCIIKRVVLSHKTLISISISAKIHIYYHKSQEYLWFKGAWKTFSNYFPICTCIVRSYRYMKYHIIYSTTGVFTKKNYNDAVYKKAFFIIIGIQVQWSLKRICKDKLYFFPFHFPYFFLYFKRFINALLVWRKWSND